MSPEKEFIAAASLGEENFTFTLPKKVRRSLNINRRFRVLTFFVEADDRIFVGFGGENAIGSSEFPASYQITIPKFARDLIKAKPGKSVGFYQEGDKIFIEKM